MSVIPLETLSTEWAVRFGPPLIASGAPEIVAQKPREQLKAKHETNAEAMLAGISR